MKEEAPAGMRRPLVVYIEKASVFFNKTNYQAFRQHINTITDKITHSLGLRESKKSSNFASCFENE